ncbi:MAG: hypothetical protein ABSE84_00125 [Isosphaeraceae bacterium]
MKADEAECEHTLIVAEPIGQPERARLIDETPGPQADEVFY